MSKQNRKDCVLSRERTKSVLSDIILSDLLQMAGDVLLKFCVKISTSQISCFYYQVCSVD